MLELNELLERSERDARDAASSERSENNEWEAFRGWFLRGENTGFQRKRRRVPKSPSRTGAFALTLVRFAVEASKIPLPEWSGRGQIFESRPFGRENQGFVVSSAERVVISTGAVPTTPASFAGRFTTLSPPC